MKRNTTIYSVLIFFFIVAAGCGSDPEGPVVERFRDGTYTPEAGETYCYIDILLSLSKEFFEEYTIFFCS